MIEDDRVDIVKRLLFEYLKSPSLRHIKDPYMVVKLAQSIVRKLDRGNSAWTKWNGPREQLVKAATACWIPVGDLREHLNRMDGPALSNNDVAQRLQAFAEEQYSEFPRDEFKEGCLAIYDAEKAQGTEMPAIVGVLREHVEREEARLEAEHAARYRQIKEDERLAAEQRLMSGADCKWTALGKEKVAHCRVNGRLYRLSPTDDKRVQLFRVDALDTPKGALLGRYLKRTDATKAVAQLAYQPEVVR